MMFEKVLFPTDFSGHAKRALECVAGLPGNREVVLLHVADIRTANRWAVEGILESAKRHLSEDKGYISSKGLQVRSVLKSIREGQVGEVILDVAREESATAIVMSARGEGMVEGLLLGTISTYVLRHSTIHLLLMRYRIIEKMDKRIYEKFCPMILSRVICPTDFSAFAERAVMAVSQLPGLGEMVLIHVVTVEETTNGIEAETSEAEARLQRTALTLKEKGIPVRYSVRIGTPPTEISTFAQEEDASLIALSSFGKGWFTDLLVGSTAAEVARISERPVIIIRDMPD
jgi:nucleotide-binding universal stress UspA family protein